MSFFKRLFEKNEAANFPIINDLEGIYKIIMPTVHPQDYDYKESFFKTTIKFKTVSNEPVHEMRRASGLQSVELVKRSGRISHWRASYTEFIALYSSPAILFIQNELLKMIEMLKELNEEATHFNSVIKYEETVRNIRQVLSTASEKIGGIEPEIVHESIQLLRQVVYEFEVELHEFKATDKRELLEQLKFEAKFMEKDQ